MKPDDVVETRKIPTRDGVLEIQMTQAFIDKVKQHFGIFGHMELEDEHVRMYVYGAVNTAVGKAEREAQDVGERPTGNAEGVRQLSR